ncbi:hypothetical protein OS493_037554 [Desmophyllum pertusum]|uniref:Uncharacterized protein n=1 Tax=Desmophyllum pertusum TaxID=174260 RepID=A0A9X0CU02_9CNID|nr:hypothetical protein OS493_037554 [Desmophyllum pertusum]
MERGTARVKSLLREFHVCEMNVSECQRHHVNTLRTDVDQLTFEVQEDRERVTLALNDISTSLEELEIRMESMQCEQEVMKQEQSFLCQTK